MGILKQSQGRLLRVVQVVNVRWFNATAWYGLFLARLLRDAGHEVRVLGLGGTESFAKAEEWGLAPEHLDLNSLNPLVLARSITRMNSLARSFRPHIVNCHRGEGFALWGLLKRTGGFRLIRTRGDQRPSRASAVNTFLHTCVADAVIATSSCIAASLRNRLAVPAARIHTIYGGVDTRAFYPDPSERSALREAWNLTPEQKAIGLVGRFDTVKGQKELISAFAALAAMTDPAVSQARLVLAGFSTSSTSEESLRTQVREAGLEGRVIWPGRCATPRALMNALDLGVVASLGSETIARVALEIMACGVPLIGTSVGVMPDLLEKEALLPPGDEPAMTAMLHRFLTDLPFGPRLAAKQHSRMLALRETDFLNQTLAVYSKALSD